MSDDDYKFAYNMGRRMDARMPTELFVLGVMVLLASVLIRLYG